MTTKQAREVCTHTLKPIEISHLLTASKYSYILIDENIERTHTQRTVSMDAVREAERSGRYFYGTKAECEKELLLRIAKYTGEANG